MLIHKDATNQSEIKGPYTQILAKYRLKDLTALKIGAKDPTKSCTNAKSTGYTILVNLELNIYMLKWGP